MLQKSKMTAYATLLLIGLFVFPYAENVTAEELCYTATQLSNINGERTTKEQLRMEKSTVACLRSEVKKKESPPYYLEMRKVIPMIFAFIALIPMVIIL